jgi:hypothetical protein
MKKKAKRQRVVKPPVFPAVPKGLTGDDRLAAMFARREAMNAWANAFGGLPVTADDEAMSDACGHASDIDRQILETPAASLIGVAIKASLLAEYAADQGHCREPSIEEAYERSGDTLDCHAAFSIWADLQRLMKGGVS